MGKTAGDWEITTEGRNPLKTTSFLCLLPLLQNSGLCLPTLVGNQLVGITEDTQELSLSNQPLLPKAQLVPPLLFSLPLSLPLLLLFS